MSGFPACATRPHPPKTLGFLDCQGTQPDGASWFYIRPHTAWPGRDDPGSQPALGCFGSEQLGSGVVPCSTTWPGLQVLGPGTANC